MTMDAIICDISGWEYWGTPPVARDVDISLEIATGGQPDGLGLSWAEGSTRSNARPVEECIRRRLLTDLKGLSMPVHVMLPNSVRYSSSLIKAHRIPKHLPKDCVVDIGGGLGVLCMDLLLAAPCRSVDGIELALAMFEACGIYAVSPENSRINHALGILKSNGGLDEGGTLNPRSKVCEYYDARGRRSSFLDEEGLELPWSLCVPHSGSSSNLWKRPPLTTLDAIASLARELRGTAGCRAVERALELAMDGSGSPLESKVALFLTASMRIGGEGWPKPKLNHHIDFDNAAQRLGNQSYCVADQLYAGTGGVLEVDGEEYHSKGLDFKRETGRAAALESMGYHVVAFTNDQIADLNNYDAVIERRAETLGLPLATRTAAFLERRNVLHAKIFGKNSSNAGGGNAGPTGGPAAGNESGGIAGNAIGDDSGA